MDVNILEERLKNLEDRIALYVEPLIKTIADKTLAPEGHNEMNPIIRWIVRQYSMEPMRERRDYLRKLFNEFAVKFPACVKNVELPEEPEEKVDIAIFEK
jgi:hypothetical protein